MLETLFIKDFAIIEQENIEFEKGFTVLSGETGAGKSILIGALSFLLGGKADLSEIRQGKHEASVSAVFLIKKDSSADKWLTDHAIETDENRITMRRFLRDNGKTGAWIGSVPVTKADLTEFSSFLIDIHGQHDHQSLMKVSEHRKFLDAQAGITDEVAKFTQIYAKLVEKRSILSNLNASETQREKDVEMLKFSIKEIEDAKLTQNEDEKLEDEESRLASFEKLYANIDSVEKSLNDSENTVVPLLKKIMRDAENAVLLDKSLTSLKERLESAFYEISDIAEGFSDYSRKLIFDPKRLEEVQDRLSVIYNLKKKYASNMNAPLKEVFDYLENAKSRLEKLENGEKNKDALLAEIASLEKQVYLEAKNISQKRKTAASTLSSEVEKVLQSLGMKYTHFSVGIAEKAGSDITQKCGPYGMDNIEFLIASNVGSEFLPLAKIASGGEISRVMLAIKTIFAKNDEVETLIFDEIDTGIGGEIGVAVGKHIKKLAENRQVLCITHLASIAVYADTQMKIEKVVLDGKTSSSVYEVSGDERVQEIARMLSGDNSEKSMEHARSMLETCSGQ